jgi:hypothetical protein
MRITMPEVAEYFGGTIFRSLSCPEYTQSVRVDTPLPAEFGEYRTCKANLKIARWVDSSTIQQYQMQTTIQLESLEFNSSCPV